MFSGDHLLITIIQGGQVHFKFGVIGTGIKKIVPGYTVRIDEIDPAPKRILSRWRECPIVMKETGMIVPLPLYSFKRKVLGGVDDVFKAVI
jgi:hypothetical protein